MRCREGAAATTCVTSSASRRPQTSMPSYLHDAPQKISTKASGRSGKRLGSGIQTYVWVNSLAQLTCSLVWASRWEASNWEMTFQLALLPNRPFTITMRCSGAWGGPPAARLRPPSWPAASPPRELRHSRVMGAYQGTGTPLSDCWEEDMRDRIPEFNRDCLGSENSW